MPYIDQDARNYLADGDIPTTAGELNYLITKQCIDYLGNTDGHYADYNAVIGVLECAKLELYRRQVAIYENAKCETNGDVY